MVLEALAALITSDTWSAWGANGDVVDADALGNNPILKNDKVIGRATGGNYGFRVQKSLAIAMVSPEFGKIGTELSMDILGKIHNVVVIADSPYDPNNDLIRA